ncbi:MAG: phospholipase [Myxococcales bacterium]|nr:phospholipase [Myxococcales bacterium]MCB9520217.1 phospholipase [Myxococcales bacterium]MCB9531139.1 phospholipase [Myxococcales bacterium]MCB9534270.1 phospholipase [Myxococcales bacterium]
MTVHDLSTETLRRLAVALRDSRGLTSAAFEALGLDDEQASIRDALQRIEDGAWLPVVEAILTERAAHAGCAPELVWTGPEAPVAESRRSVVVLREVLGSARERVLLAGYSFDGGADHLAPLHDAMVAHRVQVDIYLNINQPQASPSGPVGVTPSQVDAQVRDFVRGNWPWRDRWPNIWIDRRVLDGGVFASLHAKCAVVDGERAYVTSANFTRRGNERNVEVGVLLRDRDFAARLERQFADARRAGWFVAVDAARSRDLPPG